MSHDSIIQLQVFAWTWSTWIFKFSIS